MSNTELNKYISYMLYNFNFVDLNFDIDGFIKQQKSDESKTVDEQNLEIKKYVKSKIKEALLRSYKDNPDKFMDKMISKLEDNNIDEYNKMKIIDISVGVIDREHHIDNKFFTKLLETKKPILFVLNNLFIEEDNEASVEKELRERYKHIEPLIVMYKERYFTKFNEKNLLSLSETKALVDRIRNGDTEARDELVVRNLGLVKKMARIYASSGEHATTGYEDIFQDGVEGLMKAAEKYDYNRGTRFSTYAIYWIRQSIIRSVDNNSRTIRVPVHKNEWVYKIRRRIGELENVYGTLSPDEIMAHLNLSNDEYEEYVKLSTTTKSLNEKVVSSDGDSDVEIGDFIESDDHVEEETMRNIDNEILDELLDKVLTPRESYVLKKRYGFYDNKEFTLEEIGKELHVTRERIRQVEAKGRKKLELYYKRHFKDDPLVKSSVDRYNQYVKSLKLRSTF